MAQIMQPMKISIVVPFYEKIHFLERLMNSIEKAIQQSVHQFEIIVIIDSPETNPETIQALLVKRFHSFKEQVGFQAIHNSKNSGVAQSRNIGLELATGQWIHFIDQDDCILPFIYTEPLLKESVDFILFNGEFIYENNLAHAIYFLAPTLNTKHLILDDFIRSPGQVMLKKHFIGHTRFRTAICNKGCDDRFFWIELFANNPDLNAKYIGVKAYQAYLHASNFGNNVKGLYACSIALWEELKANMPLIYQSNIAQNVALLDYLVHRKKSWANISAYIQYQLNANKWIRFIYKRTLLLYFQLKPTAHD